MPRLTARRLQGAVFVVLAVLASVGALGWAPPPASAALVVSGPTPYSGEVAITEDVGGHGTPADGHGGACPDSLANTIIEVRNAAGEQVTWAQKSRGGSFTYDWDTHGLPRGSYTIISQGVYARPNPLTPHSSVCERTDPQTIDTRTIPVENHATMSWRDFPGTVFWGESLNVAVRLENSSSYTDLQGNVYFPPIVGRTVVFRVDGEAGSWTAITDDDGMARVEIPITQPAGETKVRASFATDCCFIGGQTQIPLEVLRRPSSLAFTGELSTSVTADFTASAVAHDRRSGALLGEGVPMVFELLSYPGRSVLVSQSTSTRSNGEASVTIDPGTLPPDDYIVRARLPRSDRYEDSEAGGLFAIVQADGTLAIHTWGGGDGAISDGHGLQCRSVCTKEYPAGSFISLTATPDFGSELRRWEVGPCAGSTEAVCSFTFDLDEDSVAAMFDLSVQHLVVSVDGQGSVAESGRILCPDRCEADYQYGADIELVATPAPGWRLAGWGGACAPVSGPTCTLDMSRDRSVSARFAPVEHTVSVTVDGDGAGTVTDGHSIVCPVEDCSASFAHGSEVTLTALHRPGSTFAGWGGACEGSDPVCTVVVEGDVAVSATFEEVPPPPVMHQVAVSVDGEGSVSGDGVGCPGTCSVEVEHGSEVSLEASPVDGWAFAGWGGACEGSDPVCTVVVEGDVAVSATFEEVPPPPPTRTCRWIDFTIWIPWLNLPWHICI